MAGINFSGKTAVSKNLISGPVFGRCHSLDGEVPQVELCKVRIVSNPTKLRVDLSCIEVRLGFRQYVKICYHKLSSVKIF